MARNIEASQWYSALGEITDDSRNSVLPEVWIEHSKSSTKVKMKTADKGSQIIRGEIDGLEKGNSMRMEVRMTLRSGSVTCKIDLDTGKSVRNMVAARASGPVVEHALHIFLGIDTRTRAFRSPTSIRWVAFCGAVIEVSIASFCCEN